MIKRFLCTILLACCSGAHAGDWQVEFFSGMTNELPASRGVAVDESGYVHLQAFNRQPWNNSYQLAHLYTIDAQGQIPWMWDLSWVDRKSDCGVYARPGQRLDCFRAAGPDGEQTRLEMRARQGSHTIWQTSLPGEFEPLSASIPDPHQDEAFFIGKLTSASGVELGIFRANGPGPADVLSVAPACPQTGQQLLSLQTYSPQDPSDRIRFIKACWNSFGITDLILEDFEPQSGLWITRDTWWIPYGASLAQAQIGPQGRPYALIEHHNGLRELLTSPSNGMGPWWTVPFPVEGKIAAFLVGHQGLAVVSLSDSPSNNSDVVQGNTHHITWFDGDGWPFITTHRFAGLDEISPNALALSSEGEVLVVGSPLYAAGQPDRLLFARRSRELQQIAELPQTPNEVDAGRVYLVGGPNNVAVVARTLHRSDHFGQIDTGIRVNQYDLP
jgi:hypothetical protein